MRICIGHLYCTLYWKFNVNNYSIIIDIKRTFVVFILIPLYKQWLYNRYQTHIRADAILEKLLLSSLNVILGVIKV